MVQFKNQPSPGWQAARAFIACAEFYTCDHCPRCASKEGLWMGFVQRKDKVTMHKRRCKQCGRWFYGVAYLPKRSPRTRELDNELRHEAWLESYEDEKRGESA